MKVYTVRMRRLEAAYRLSSFRVLATSREAAEAEALRVWGGWTLILPPIMRKRKGPEVSPPAQGLCHSRRAIAKPAGR